MGIFKWAECLDMLPGDKADRGENPLVEKWKSEVFEIVMCLLAFQLMLVMLGRIFNV
jgi:hypothetical protein